MKITIALLLLLGSCTLAAEFRPSERGITIVTERYEIVWRDGAAHEISTLLPRRQLLTLPDGGMSAAELPVGMGSFHGQAKEECMQNRILYGLDLEKEAPAYPAQFAPGESSRLTVEEIPNGRRLTYSGLGSDTSATLVQELTVEPATGELLMRQRARSENPGLFGISMTLLNLRPDIDFAVPYFGGQRFGGSMEGNQLVSYSWPQFWQAGLLVGELPEGGSFFLMSDDGELRPKYFKLYHTDARQGLSVQHSPEGPYDEVREIEVAPWRFNTFGGNWLEPAMRYRAWLTETYDLKPMTERPVTWFDQIALAYAAYPSITALETLAKKIDPKHILVIDLGWAEGFNRKAPLYTPRSKNYRESVDAAHALGVRLGVYTSMKLVDHHAHPLMMHEMGVTYFYDALNSDPPPPPAPVVEAPDRHFLAYIHPGSNRWIDFYSDVMVDLQNRYDLDLLYQDVSGGQRGSAGVIDGRGLHQGTVACDAAIQRKLPTTALGGEYWSEVMIAGGEVMGLQNMMSWFGEGHQERLARHAHPIQSAIFAPFSTYMTYKTPMRSGAKFHYDQNQIEAMGAIPTWKGAADERGGEADIVLSRAKLLAEGFRPHFPEAWAANVSGYLRHPDGRIIRYERDGLSSFCYEGEALRYARITGRSAWQGAEPVHIDGWHAYANGGPIGLDAESWYCLMPGASTAGRITVRELWEGTWITGSRESDTYTLITFGGAGDGELKGELVTDGTPAVRLVEPGQVLLAADASAPLTVVDEPLALDEWQKVIVAQGRVLQETEWHRPPTRWQLGEKTMMGYTVFPPLGGAGSEISIDSYVELPSSKALALRVHLGRLGGAGDGVHYVIRVNGREIWRQLSPGTERGWETAVIPLSEYAGKSVVLSLAVDNGPSGFSLSNDAAIWGEPMFVEEEPITEAPALD